MVAAFGAPALAILILAALVGAIPAWLANRQLGGQTGDVLGAVQQVAEAAGWVALTALL
jgi:adenosylcobinamide-GDP ribazoletransferase